MKSRRAEPSASSWAKLLNHITCFFANWLFGSLWTKSCPSLLHVTVLDPNFSHCYEDMLSKSISTGTDSCPCLVLTAIILSLPKSLSRTLCPLKGRPDGLSVLTRRAAVWGVNVGGRLWNFCVVKSEQFNRCSVQSLSRVWLFATPWTAARQASLSITNSQSLLKLMSSESVRVN